MAEFRGPPPDSFSFDCTAAARSAAAVSFYTNTKWGREVGKKKKEEKKGYEGEGVDQSTALLENTVGCSQIVRTRRKVARAYSYCQHYRQPTFSAAAAIRL